MKITVIGQGYVGLTVAIEAAKAHNTVIGFDTDLQVIENLKKGSTHVPGIETKEIVKLIKSGAYFPTNEKEFLIDSEVIIIAVPTPLNISRKPELIYLELAAKLIGECANDGTLVVNESTSYPGTLRNFIKPTIEKISFKHLLYAAAPERVDPGNKNWNLKNTPRVIAGMTDEAAIKAISFYSSFCENVYQAQSVEVAEASKLFENTYRQVNIALVNEFSEIANSLGFSTSEAIEAASTKPFGFTAFYPSIGVGGHCIPVDPSYLSYAAELSGTETKLIDLANKTNQSAHIKVVQRIKDYMSGEIKDVKIQLAGITYKPNISDLRESPALDLIKELKIAGAVVSWHDPFVKSYEGQQSVALTSEVDLGLIVTPHSQIDFSIWKKADIKVLDLSANSNNYGWPKFL
jgi:UDP-N-acetyl-D-glucosamine dehydrogenase